MIRTLLLAFGVIEVLAPARIVEYAERLALENPGESTLRPVTLPIARLEGIVFMAVVLRGRDSVRRFEQFLPVLGIPAVLFPQRYVDFGARLAYEDAEGVEWKPWVVPATRLLGLLYVVAGVRARKREQ